MLSSRYFYNWGSCELIIKWDQPIDFSTAGHGAKHCEQRLRNVIDYLKKGEVINNFGVECKCFTLKDSSILRRLECIRYIATYAMENRVYSMENRA